MWIVQVVNKENKNLEREFEFHDIGKAIHTVDLLGSKISSVNFDILLEEIEDGDT